jgi:hypothetical protein
MSIFTDEELGQIVIERMIFHVVGPSIGDTPILLEEISPPQHTEFFLERILSVSAANRYKFLPDASFRAELGRIATDINQFSGISRVLAGRFQTGHIASTKNGVFLMFVLRLGQERAYAVVKYDHDQVVSYQITESDGRKTANLTELHDTFVRKPEAMQKSALIRLGPNGDIVAAKDRSTRDGITEYFRVFLGVRREFENRDLTKRLHTALVNTFNAHRDELPDTIRRSFRQRLFDHLNGGGTFDADDASGLLSDALGNAGATEAVLNTFSQQLRANKIDGATFTFDPVDLKAPRIRQVVTQEGIRIILDQGLNDRITTVPHGHETIIQIRTVGIVSDEPLTEADLRRR